MAVESAMIELGTQAPAFSLKDVVTGDCVDSASTDGAPLLVMFLCGHCPYVKHLNSALAQFSRDYAETPLQIIGIASNDTNRNEDDSPEGLKRQAEQFGFGFPYLLDESQDVARAYSAVCTPDFFLFDSEHRLVYRGQFDGSRPGNDTEPTGDDLRAACDALLAGEAVPTDQRPSAGCSIKWIEE
jgi:thiol-disulfide isomerase/thioredoxin